MFDFEDSISVTLAADNNYAMPLAVTLASVLENTTGNLNLFLIDGGISQKSKSKIEKLANSPRIRISWIIPDLEKLSWLELKGRFTKTTYQRLFLPEWIPHNIKKIIYLDCDILVLEDLRKLWSLEMDDHYISAARDTGIPYISSPMTSIYNESINAPKDSKYFNSGVMVINLEKWRETRLPDRSLDYLKVNQSITRWADQDVLNALLVNQWQELPPQWNQMHKVYSYANWPESPFKASLSDVVEELIENPFIIHFSSSPKPWSPFCIHPRKSLFFQYLAKTPWSSWQLNLQLFFQEHVAPQQKKLRKVLERVSGKINHLVKQN